MWRPRWFSPLRSPLGAFMQRHGFFTRAPPRLLRKTRFFNERAFATRQCSRAKHVFSTNALRDDRGRSRSRGRHVALLCKTLLTYALAKIRALWGPSMAWFSAAQCGAAWQARLWPRHGVASHGGILRGPLRQVAIWVLGVLL